MLVPTQVRSGQTATTNPAAGFDIGPSGAAQGFPILRRLENTPFTILLQLTQKFYKEASRMPDSQGFDKSSNTKDLTV